MDGWINEWAGDLARRVAMVRLVDVKYFTSTIDHTSISLLNNAGTAAAYPDRPLPSTSMLPPGRLSSAQCGPAEVRVEFTGYNKIWQGSGRVFDTVEMRDLPEVGARPFGIHPSHSSIHPPPPHFLHISPPQTFPPTFTMKSHLHSPRPFRASHPPTTAVHPIVNKNHVYNIIFYTLTQLSAS